MPVVVPVQGLKYKVQASRFAPDASARRKSTRLVPVLLNWFAHNARDLPWRRTRDPYAIWVSEIMLQQTQVSTVIPYYQRWMRTLPTVQSLARASSQHLHKLWEGLGYYTRIRNMQKAAGVICQEYHGRFPDQFDQVVALPGIGRYTAGAICSIAFNQPTPILDGNVIRVVTRVFGITADPKETKTNDYLWRLAGTLVSAAAGLDRRSEVGDRKWARIPCSALNQSLMELGATVCAPVNPNCPQCPVRRSCMAHREGTTDQIPQRPARSSVTSVKKTIVIPEFGKRFWAAPRPHGTLNHGLWEFPETHEFETAGDGPNSQCLISGRPNNLEFLGTFKHTITRYRISAEVFLWRTPWKPTLKKGGRWLTAAALQQTAFSAMHRRIATQLVKRKRVSDRPRTGRASR